MSDPVCCSSSARGTRVGARPVCGDADAGDAGEAGAACRSESPPGATHTTCRCTRRARRRDRGPGTADAHAGPWTRVAAAGGRAAAHIAAHMMPSRPINPPTGSSRTPLGASSLVPSASPTTQTFADHSWSAEIRSTAAGRLARAAGRRRAELAILLTLRGSGCSCAPAGGPAVLRPSRRTMAGARPRRGPSKDRAGPMALLVKRLLKHT